MTSPARRPHPDHPCPTFARDAWTSLDGPWDFAIGTAGDQPGDLIWDRTITVPFPPESDASGVGEPWVEYPRYRRHLEIDPAPGRRILLHCEGIDHEARVWVNGHLVGTHTGGYTPLVCDITEALRAGPSGDPGGRPGHELVIAATDLVRDLEQPRGKQGWHDSPAIIWYGRSSGIWRSVWWEEVPEVRLESAGWVTLDTFGRLQGTIRIAGWTETPPSPETPLTVEASFAHQDVHLGTVTAVATASVVEVTARLGVAGHADTPWLYWSPDNPALIDLRLRLLRGDEVLDEVSGYTGLRTVGVRDGHLELNGVATFSRLVLEQAYWPDSHFTAPSADALRAEASLIKELGFNGLRMHQVSADPRFLRACDEHGLMVWADVPAAYVFTPRALARTTATLTELVDRDRNHPCLVGWVPFNESWGVPQVATSRPEQDAVTALAALARALDPTRLVIGNDGWENVAGDLIGIHDYTHDPGVLTARYRDADARSATIAGGRPGGHVVLARPFPGGTPALLSEFGGVSLPASADQWGYGTVPDAEALVARVAALVAEVGPRSGLVGFCWTQLTDCLQEQNGLLWPDRTPKAPVDALAAAIRGLGPA